MKVKKLDDKWKELEKAQKAIQEKVTLVLVTLKQSSNESSKASIQ